MGHPERRLAEAAKHGCQAVIAPRGAGEGACEASTLREALALALPRRGAPKIDRTAAQALAARN